MHAASKRAAEVEFCPSQGHDYECSADIDEDMGLKSDGSHNAHRNNLPSAIAPPDSANSRIPVNRNRARKEPRPSALTSCRTNPFSSALTEKIEIMVGGAHGQNKPSAVWWPFVASLAASPSRAYGSSTLG